METIKLAIKYCNTAVDEPCSICGQEMSLSIPLELFLDNTYEPVCRTCGEKYAPSLVKLLRVADIFIFPYCEEIIKANENFVQTSERS